MDTPDLAFFCARCPKLTTLQLDIRLEASTWDYKLLGTLASFTQLQALALNVHHVPSDNVATARLDTHLRTEQLFKNAAVHILAERCKIPGCRNLYVAFTETCDYDEDDETSVGSDPDITFFMDENGNVRAKTEDRRKTGLREKYANCPTEQLRQSLQRDQTTIAGLSCFRMQALCKVEEEINEELERRRRLEMAGSKDVLTIYHRNVVGESL